MMAAVTQDSAQEVSRGKWLAVNSICTAFGVLFMALFFARLPDLLVARGYEPALAERYAFWAVAGFCTVTGVLIMAGLRKGVTAADPAKVSIWRKLGEGI